MEFDEESKEVPLAIAPWEDVPHVWKTEKAYLSWLRSQIRRIWSRHPIKTEYKKSRRFKAPLGRNGKDIFACTCEICGETFKSSETEVDHIIPGGGFKDWEGFCEWAKRILWVTSKELRELCKECHSVVTLSQKLNCSFEEAKIEKRVIATNKLDATSQKRWLIERGVTPSSNKKGRDEQVRLVLGGTNGGKNNK